MRAILAYAITVGAALAANTGKAGAMRRVACFAGDSEAFGVQKNQSQMCFSDTGITRLSFTAL